MQNRSPLLATLKVSKQAETAALDALVLEMAELLLKKHRKIAEADRTAFLQARLPHFKRKRSAAYQALANTLAKHKEKPPELTPHELESLNILAQQLAADVEKHTQQHWTLTLLHRHYLKAIRLDKKAIQACRGLPLNNEHAQAVLDTQNTYLESLDGLLTQLETTLSALSTSTTSEDQFAKAPEILTGLLEKSLIGDEANLSNKIKRFIFRAIAPEIINPDNISLSDEQTQQLDALVDLVLSISNHQTATQTARAHLTPDQIEALRQLGVTLRPPMHYITNGVLEPLKQTTSDVTHTTRATQAAYNAIQRRRNAIDLMKNLTTVLDETNQLNSSLITAQFLKDTSSEEESTGLVSYLAHAGIAMGKALYQGANTFYSWGQQAVNTVMPAKKTSKKDLLAGKDDETTLAMAAFLKIITTFNLNGEARRQCLNIFKHQSSASFTLADYEGNAANLNATHIQLALALREIRDLLLASPDESTIEKAISDIIAANAAINAIQNENHRAGLKDHLNDLLLTLHKCVLLPVLYEMLDNQTTSGIAEITLQRMISHLESGQSTPSRDEWHALKKHAGVAKLSLFQKRKQLPSSNAPVGPVSALDITNVKTPAQQTEAQIKTVIDASLPTLFHALIAAIDAERTTALRLHRHLKKNKHNVPYCEKLKKKIELCNQLLRALDVIKNTNTSNIAKNLSRTLHGYTLSDANTLLQNNLASPFKLANRLLMASNHLAEMNGILATNRPVLSKCLNMLFSQCDFSEATQAMNAFHSDNAPISEEDALWFNDALQDPLSSTTLPSAVVANTLTQSTEGIVNLLRSSAAEAPGMIVSKLLKLLPELFPGMSIASLVIRQVLKSSLISTQVERILAENSSPEVLATKIVNYFITSYGQEASTLTPEALTTKVLLGSDENETAESYFTEFFFKFHRLCLLKKINPNDMLAELDARNEITLEARAKCVALHQALYGTLQSNTMREGLQALIMKDQAHAHILLLHRAKQQMNLALKQEAEGKTFADIQSLIEEAYLSLEFLQAHADKLEEKQNTLVSTLLTTLTEKLSTQTTTLLKETASLKQDSTLTLQKTRINSKTLASEANAAKKNVPHVLLRAWKVARNFFSVASFWYSTVIAPLFLSTTTTGGYLLHFIGFALAGSSPLLTALGYASFSVMILSVIAQFGYGLYCGQDKFRKVWDNKTDNVPMKILKTAGYVGLIFAKALFNTILSTFAVDAIKTLAKSAWSKIAIFLHRKSMLKEIDSLNTELEELHTASHVNAQDRNAQLSSLHEKITNLKNKLAASKHQASVLQPLKEKLTQLETRMEKLRNTLNLVSPQSQAKIYQALNINRAAQGNPDNEPMITLQELTSAKTQGKIHTYSEEPLPPAPNKPSRLRLSN